MILTIWSDKLDWAQSKFRNRSERHVHLLIDKYCPGESLRSRAIGR
jgi:hypothetical protein